MKRGIFIRLDNKFEIVSDLRNMLVWRVCSVFFLWSKNMMKLLIIIISRYMRDKSRINDRGRILGCLWLEFVWKFELLFLLFELCVLDDLLSNSDIL